MCVRCEIDDCVSDFDWDRLVGIALDLRSGRRTCDPHEELAEGDVGWTSWIDSAPYPALGSDSEPHHPVAEWVTRRLLGSNLWRRRLLDEWSRPDERT